MLIILCELLISAYENMPFDSFFDVFDFFFLFDWVK